MTVAKSCCCIQEKPLCTLPVIPEAPWAEEKLELPDLNNWGLGTGDCALPIRGFPGGTVVKNLPDNVGDAGDIPAFNFNPWVGKIPQNRK